MGGKSSVMEGVERLMGEWDYSFYRNKRVFITGHTGFKGAWLCRMLRRLGAEVSGYGLYPPETPNLYELAGIKEEATSYIGDIRDYQTLKEAFDKAEPEIVFHLAAQPLVRDSYKNPAYTYETNVMGTVNILECVRESLSGRHPVQSFLNVTTDKVYKNKEWEWGYRENEELDGYDPYSNSKSCSELVTHSYRASFFTKERENRASVSTARAGNVIGGGDFAKERIIADCVRAAGKKQEITVRNPGSTRPYQHVLEPLYAYLMIAAKQYDERYAGYYNVGPDESDCYQTGKLVDTFCKKWKERTGETIPWKSRPEEGPHEANLLKLDCARLKKTFGWKPLWDVERALEMVVDWSVRWMNGEDMKECMDRQIAVFFAEADKRNVK